MEKEAIPTLSAYENRVFEVDYADWRHVIDIVDPSTQRAFYTLRGRGCNVPYEITNADGQHIATTKTSSMSSKIAVEMTGWHGEPLTFDIRNDKLLGMVGSPRYDSPAFDGQTMTWKNTAMSRDIIYTLIEGRGLAVARFQSNRKTQIGKLELVGSEMNDAKIHEIMIVLLTLLKRKLKAIQNSNDAAVVAAIS